MEDEVVYVEINALDALESKIDGVLIPPREHTYRGYRYIPRISEHVETCYSQWLVIQVYPDTWAKVWFSACHQNPMHAGICEFSDYSTHYKIPRGPNEITYQMD